MRSWTKHDRLQEDGGGAIDDVDVDVDVDVVVVDVVVVVVNVVAVVVVVVVHPRHLTLKFG